MAVREAEYNPSAILASVKTLGLSTRGRLARPSPTLAITAKANALKAEGKDVISFGAGEPDFNSPDVACEAAAKAIREGFTKYTPTPGIPALREEIAAKLQRDNRIPTSAAQIVVSCGGKQALYNALTAVVDEGSEVILLSPFWATYRDQVELSGGRAVVVPCRSEDNFEPDLDAIRAALTDRTRAILFNSPNNPTGAVYSRETIEGLAAIADRQGLWLITDEMYEKLVYDGQHVSVASLGQSIADRTITVGGCSKTYSMTGWRVGYSSAPLEVAKAMSAIQDAVTSNATSFAQKGALAALQMPQESVEAMRREFIERRDFMRHQLAQISGLNVPNPGGAFYFFLDIRPFLGGKIATDADLAEFLLEDALVAAVPGCAFEAEGFLRLSYTSSREDIARGISRMAECLSKLP